MPDKSPSGREGAAGVYDRPARRSPWPMVAAGVAASAGVVAIVLWLT